MGKTIFVLLFLVSAVSVSAQRTSAHATVEPAEILIGEHALVTLRVIAPEGTSILFPEYENELIPGIEVLGMLPPDTTIENSVMTINFHYVITSFDSTLYYVPFMPISDGKDTIFSNSFGFKVDSPELTERTLTEIERINTGQTSTLDFEQLEINDLKPIHKAPFVWTDWLWILWIFLGVLLLAAILGGLFYLYLRKKNKGYFFTPPIVIPPHVLAIREIDKLKAEKVWQQGREKEFYTKLTDILRIYMSERYGVNALEMTSGEIMNEIEKLAETDSVCENLKQILSTSDLVKFAKYKPYIDENDLSLMNAYFFVNQTREADPIEKEKKEEEEN
ncbi:MAG: hypothetical protein LBI15_05650 [Dysgonamonadaceae bacterium]|nr:hypothetical protein [Dysgonamonadaceae bacterium]